MPSSLLNMACNSESIISVNQSPLLSVPLNSANNNLATMPTVTQVSQAKSSLAFVKARRNKVAAESNKEIYEFIDDNPVEHNADCQSCEICSALAIDLKQAQNLVVLHKTIAEDAERRMERNAAELKALRKARSDDNAAALEVKRLRKELEDQQKVVKALMKDNEDLREQAKIQHEQDMEMLRLKDEELEEAKSKAKESETEDDTMIDTLSGLVDVQEQEKAELTTDLNVRLAELRTSNVALSAIVSETRPLCTFLVKSVDHLNHLKDVIGAVSTSDARAAVKLGDSLGKSITTLQTELDNHHVLRQAVEEEQGEQTINNPVQNEVDDLAKNAHKLFDGFETLQVAASAALTRVKEESDTASCKSQGSTISQRLSGFAWRN